MLEIIIAIFYQPFLNALVLIYLGLSYVFENPSMGLAVIVFTLLVRVLLLPLTIASTESEDERRKIAHEYDALVDKYENSQPLIFQEKKQELIRDNQSTVRFEAINITIQLVIAVILWRVFSQGLTGEDLHLLYGFMPAIEEPFNLTFAGSIDLTHPDLALNLISSALLFIVETLQVTFSPLPASRQDRIMQFLLPGIVFFYLYTMPAGKKLFVITTLIISILIILLREINDVMKLAAAQKTKK